MYCVSALKYCAYEIRSVFIINSNCAPTIHICNEYSTSFPWGRTWILKYSVVWLECSKFESSTARVPVIHRCRHGIMNDIMQLCGTSSCLTSLIFWSFFFLRFLAPRPSTNICILRADASAKWNEIIYRHDVTSTVFHQTAAVTVRADFLLSTAPHISA